MRPRGPPKASIRQKTPITGVKWQETNWENFLTNYISDKGLISKICSVLEKNITLRNGALSWTETSQRWNPNGWETNKCSPPVVEIKTTFVRMSKIKRQMTAHAGEDGKKETHLFTAGIGNRYGVPGWDFSRRIEWGEGCEAGKKGTMGRRTNTKGHLRIHMETHY